MAEEYKKIHEKIVKFLASEGYEYAGGTFIKNLRESIMEKGNISVKFHVMKYTKWDKEA